MQLTRSLHCDDLSYSHTVLYPADISSIWCFCLYCEGHSCSAPLSKDAKRNGAFLIFCNIFMQSVILPAEMVMIYILRPQIFVIYSFLCMSGWREFHVWMDHQYVFFFSAVQSSIQTIIKLNSCHAIEKRNQLTSFGRLLSISHRACCSTSWLNPF